MKQVSKYIKYLVLILVALVHVFKQTASESRSMKFKVTDDAEALFYSVVMAEWSKISSKIECQVMCGTVEGCIRAEYNEEHRTCTAYGASNSKTSLQPHTTGSVITEKIWSDQCPNGGKVSKTGQCESVSPTIDTQIGGYTNHTTGCQCWFDMSQTNCACCRPGGCQCGAINRQLCVECGHSENCVIGPDSQTTFVGCTSWSEMNQKNLSDQQLLTFEKTSVNSGHFYNSTTFMCPCNGIYFVALTIDAFPGGGGIFGASVYKGNNDIMHVFDGEKTGNTLSNSVLVHCLAEETIVVKSFKSGSVKGNVNIPCSTFTIIMIHNITANHSDFIGFSVDMAPGITHYNPGDVLNFTGQILNEGARYDTTTGQFRCPVTGVYFVTFSLHKDLAHQLELGLELNGTIILHAVKQNTPQQVMGIRNVRLVTCAKGEVMMMKAIGSGDVVGGSIGKLSILSTMLMERKNYGISEMGPFPLVGFTATKTSNQTYNVNTTVIFDKVLLSKGDNFDPSSSTFSCPYLGIYYVTVTAKKYNSANVTVDVKHGSTVVFRLMDTSADPDRTVSNSALVRCGPGEDIKVVGAGDGDIYGDSHYISTTFTVMLMHKEG